MWDQVPKSLERWEHEVARWAEEFGDWELIERPAMGHMECYGVDPWSINCYLAGIYPGDESAHDKVPLRIEWYDALAQVIRPWRPSKFVLARS